MAALLLCGGALAQPLSSPGPDDLVRLHVVAADDSPGAQALKLAVRDACLDCARLCISDAQDADAAYMRLNQHLDDFLTACRNRARQLGYDGEIAAQAGVFSFPDRIYGDVRVPAGQYRALRVIIGAGEGHNWWCVLYPSLCALDESALDDPGSILSWIKRRFGGVEDA